MGLSEPEHQRQERVSSRSIALPPNHDNWLEAIKIYRFQDDHTVRFVPEGRFEILIQFGGAFFHRINNGTWKKRPLGFIGGLHNQSYEVRAENPQSYCLGIKIKPAYTYDLLKSDLYSMNNAVIDLRDIWGKNGNEFIEALHRERSLNLQITRLLQITNEIKVNIRDQRKVRFHELLEQEMGAIKVAELAKSVHLSEPQFRRVFKKSIGMSAKDFCKITRVQRIAQILKNETCNKLSDLAYDYGYYDQAHMIKDFKAVTGQTPSQYARVG